MTYHMSMQLLVFGSLAFCLSMLAIAGIIQLSQNLLNQISRRSNGSPNRPNRRTFWV